MAYLFSADAEVEQQQLRQASVNQNSYNALTVVLAVIVAVVVVVLAVIVAGMVWSIIKKKEEIKERCGIVGSVHVLFTLYTLFQHNQQGKPFYSLYVWPMYVLAQSVVVW